MAMHNPLTGYEPNVLHNFDRSETSAAIGDIDTEPSYLCHAELDVGKALSSPLFVKEREETANLRQAYHSHEESLLPAWSFRTLKYGDQYTNQVRLKNGNPVVTWKTEKSGVSLKDKKSKFSLKSELRFRSTSFKPSLIEEVSRN